MTYDEAIQFLYGLQLFGTHFGLERTRQLAALAGNPQAKLRFIHVAGTNGKGSTCAILESIYHAAGLRVGLFTSPHLVSFRERMQINRQLIAEADVARLVAEIQPLLRQFPADAHPTMFEVVAVLALKYFAEQQCDLVVWETGMGGRLDATNIVTPLASLITNIGLDHQQWLGDTLEKIAAEKAGIIKPGVPVLTAADAPESLDVIEEVARAENAPLTKVTQASRLRDAVRTAALALPGAHQKINAELALATVDVLQNQIPVSADQIHTGLSNINWPGRLQLIQRPDGQKILLDGAHNLAGAEALRTAVQSLFSLHETAMWSAEHCSASRDSEIRAEQCSALRFRASRDPKIVEAPPEPKDGGTNTSPHPSPPLKDREKPLLIFGALADKNWPEICRVLAPLAEKIFAVPVASGRTANPGEVAAAFRSANPGLSVAVFDNLPDALNASKDEPFVVITGSLYLIGEALEQLGFPPADASERGLNEWPAAKTAR